VVDLGARGKGKGDCNTSREGLERREDKEGKGEARKVDGVRCDMVCLIGAEAGADFIRAAKERRRSKEIG
jgi:hypothetical protein